MQSNFTPIAIQNYPGHKKLQLNIRFDKLMIFI